MSGAWAEVVPRLWTPSAWLTLVIVAVSAAAGCVVGTVEAFRRRHHVQGRAHLVCRSARGGPGRGEGTSRGPLLKGRAALHSRRVREGAGAAGAGAAALLLLGGPLGWAAGAVAAWAAWRWLRRQSDRDATRDQDEQDAEEQLPLAADLMAACLAAGAGPERAAEAVGGSIGGPLGERLTGAATELRLGAEPALVWGRFAQRPWGVEFARCMERAGVAGVPPVESVTRLAGELRARWARAANSRARRAAVLVTGPLGLCFLPAFLAIGVAPVLLGLARSLW